MFDPEKFGEAMGEVIRKAVAPLHAEIDLLKSQLAQKPDFAKMVADEVRSAVASIQMPKDGKDCDMNAVKTIIDDAVKAIPVPKDGKDGVDGQDGKSISVDDFMPTINEAIKSMNETAQASIDAAIKAIPIPKDGKDGVDGSKGDPGEKGADGLGLAGAMIDRDGALMITMTNGEVKSLGQVVGKNGTDGKDGIDGIGLDSFELEYIDEMHEIAVKASCAGRVKELRYPAGGIRPAGYWREGTKAKAGEAWVHDGSTYFCIKDTSGKPETKSSDWIIGARRGRDGERGQKGADAIPPAPIKLKD